MSNPIYTADSPDGCNCEGGDGYSEMPTKCLLCVKRDDLIENELKPLDERGISPCPLCKGQAICWINTKNTTDFYAIGCIDVEHCGVEMTGWLVKEQMIKHWNTRPR